MQRLGLTSLSKQVLTRQLKHRCTNGMWQMWETEAEPESPGLFIVQGLASTAIYDHYLTTRDTAFLRHASRAAQPPPNRGQFDSARPSARTPHVGPQHE